MKFLLDTNIVSDLVANPFGIVAQRVRASLDEEYCTSIIVACELSYGFARRPGKKTDAFRKQWNELRDIVPVLGLSQKVIDAYCRARLALEHKGTPIGVHDLLIAAHADTEDAVVVTDNVKEFSRVPGLRVENWLRPADDDA